MIYWWKDNLKRPSTWIGLILIGFALIILFYDPVIIHTLLMNIVNSPQLAELIISGIMGGLGHFLIGYKKKEDDRKDTRPDS